MSPSSSFQKIQTRVFTLVIIWDLFPWIVWIRSTVTAWFTFFVEKSWLRVIIWEANFLYYIGLILPDFGFHLIRSVSPFFHIWLFSLNCIAFEFSKISRIWLFRFYELMKRERRKIFLLMGKNTRKKLNRKRDEMESHASLI